MYNLVIKAVLLLVATMVFSCSQTSPQENTSSEISSELDSTYDIQSEMNSDRIIDSLNIFLSRNSGDAAVFAARSKRHLALKNLSQAINDAELAYAIDSTDTFVLEVFGDVHYITNRTRISKEAWEKCIEIDAGNISCRMKLAELYNVIEEYRKSLRLVNEVLERDKSNAVAYFLKGLNIVYVFKDTAQAVPYIQRALELDENYYEALDLLGVWLTQRRDPLGLPYLQRAAALSNSALSYYKIGFLHKELNEFDLAIVALDKAIQINPKDIESLYLMGYCYVELEEYEAAIKTFDNCLAIKELNHRAYYARGYTHELLDNLDKARMDFANALRYNPDHEPSRKALQRLQRGN